LERGERRGRGEKGMCWKRKWFRNNISLKVYKKAYLPEVGIPKMSQIS
jgi:hypothetical protein